MALSTRGRGPHASRSRSLFTLGIIRYLLMMLMIKLTLNAFRLLRVPPLAQCVAVTLCGFLMPRVLGCMTEEACANSDDGAGICRFGARPHRLAAQGWLSLSPICDSHTYAPCSTRGNSVGGAASLLGARAAREVRPLHWTVRRHLVRRATVARLHTAGVQPPLWTPRLPLAGT